MVLNSNDIATMSWSVRDASLGWKSKATLTFPANFPYELFVLDATISNSIITIPADILPTGHVITVKRINNNAWAASFVFTGAIIDSDVYNANSGGVSGTINLAPKTTYKLIHLGNNYYQTLSVNVDP